MSRSSSSAGVVERFHAENLQIALLVLSDTAQFGGEDAGYVKWARLVVANDARQREFRLVSQ